MSSFYEVLGLRPSAHPVEIESAYQVLKDLPELDFEDQIGISVAYKTLIYPSRRAEYDRELISKTKVQQPVAQLQQPVIVYKNVTPLNLSQPKNESASTAVWFMGGVVGMCLLFVIGLVV
jgi:hypothetical protein